MSFQGLNLMRKKQESLITLSIKGWEPNEIIQLGRSFVIILKQTIKRLKILNLPHLTFLDLKNDETIKCKIGMMANQIKKARSLTQIYLELK